MGIMFPQFKDIVEISPKELNSISIELNYEETSVRHVKETYFYHLWCLNKNTTKKKN